MTLSLPFPGVTRREENRLVVWNRELTGAHERLRRALRVTRDALEAGVAEPVRADLLLYCHGFCAALSGQHRGTPRPALTR